MGRLPNQPVMTLPLIAVLYVIAPDPAPGHTIAIAPAAAIPVSEEAEATHDLDSLAHAAGAASAIWHAETPD
ncbi:MAG: hypothetical protein AAF919_19075 [Pseudomonadota bacterium]